MMESVAFDKTFLRGLSSKTVIITGGANGIGAQTVRLCHTYGANVIIADLASSQNAANNIITSLPAGSQQRMIYIPTNTTSWNDLKHMFSKTISAFGSVQIVIANAGVMESTNFWDFDQLDEQGDPLEPKESSRVIDINLKGTMNTLKLAMYHMRSNPPCFPDSSRGSIILISSTSGYFGSSGVASYISSKHGVTGVLRASQGAANQLGIRVNGIAPFYTPTHMTSGYSALWSKSSVPGNTVDDLAQAITQAAMDSSRRGKCFLVALGKMIELETFYNAMVPGWVGSDVAELMNSAGRFMKDIGGYKLPQERPKL